MPMEIWLKFIVSIISFSATVMLTFTIFKIPLKEHHKLISLIALILGTVSFYTRFIVESQLFPLIVLSFYVVMLMVLKRYPIFYSFIVCSIGYVLGALIDAVVSGLFVYFGFTTFEEMTVSVIHFLWLNLSSTLVQLLIIFIFMKRKLGFSFIIKRFTAKRFLKGYNFVWAGLIVLSITIVQLGSMSKDRISVHSYVFAGIALTFLVVVAIAYNLNKKMVKDRFGRG